MKPPPHRLGWLPPLTVGAAAAVAAEVSMAVLLYGGTGLVRSLTTVLAVQGLALGAGLAARPAPGPDLVDRVRRRWLNTLLAFVAAASFGTAWSLVPVVSEGRLGQGTGLALLAALPLYACGTVLTGMVSLAASDTGQRLRPPGAAATVGAAVGFVLTGLLLPTVPAPASLLVGSLVLLSLGGMVYGVVLAVRSDERTVATRPGRGAAVRVVERRTPIEAIAVRELLEGDVVRRAAAIDQKRDRDVDDPWDVRAVRSLLKDRRDPRVLLIGGGASSVPAALAERISIEVVERTPAVVELAREHFETGLTLGTRGAVTVTVGNLDDAIAGRDGSYDVVVVDQRALKPIGGAAGLSSMARRRLPALLRDGGALVWGPATTDFVMSESPGWVAERHGRSSRANGAPAHTREELIVVRRADSTAASTIDGFERATGR